MKFVLGPVPEDQSFEPEKTGWRALREPDPVMLNLIAIPIALVVLGALVVVIRSFTAVPIKDVMVRVFPSFLLMIPLHELVHALFTPRLGATPQTLLGCWPARILFYAFYLGELSRERFLAFGFAPFIVITVIPLLVISVLSLNAPWAAAMALANAVGASGDLLGVFLVLTQIPRGAIVRNKGWRSYWRRPALLTTARLILRPVESTDVDQLHALWREADVRKFLWDDVMIARETAQAVVRRSAADWRDRGYGLWTALDAESRELAGFVGFRSSATREEPELLFGFHPRYWHQGLATEALQTVLAWLGPRAIWAATDPPNVASTRLLERVLGERASRPQ